MSIEPAIAFHPVAEAYDETPPVIHYLGFVDGVEFAHMVLAHEAIPGACSISGWLCVCFLA
jgi:hypothetical protein